MVDRTLLLWYDMRQSVKSRHAERGVSRRPPLNGWIVVVLVVVLVPVLAHAIVLVLELVNRAENDYDHDRDRDDDYDNDDDEDEDEYDSIPLCRCGLRRQLSPRDENIDSSVNRRLKGTRQDGTGARTAGHWACRGAKKHEGGFCYVLLHKVFLSCLALSPILMMY